MFGGRSLLDQPLFVGRRSSSHCDICYGILLYEDTAVAFACHPLLEKRRSELNGSWGTPHPPERLLERKAETGCLPVTGDSQNRRTSRSGEQKTPWRCMGAGHSLFAGSYEKSCRPWHLSASSACPCWGLCIGTRCCTASQRKKERL